MGCVGRKLAIFACLCAALPLLADEEPAQGKLLVADPKLGDPHFARTVVYLITYDDEGAVGLILNRETDTPVTKILNGIKEASNRKDLAFEGGPVEPSSVLALHRTTTRKKGSRRVSNDGYALLDEAVLKEALAGGADGNSLRFYRGYAGWGPGQLDNEIDAGGWFVLSGGAKVVFDEHPETLWERLVRHKDEQVARSRAG